MFKDGQIRQASRLPRPDGFEDGLVEPAGAETNGTGGWAGRSGSRGTKRVVLSCGVFDVSLL